MNHRHVTLRQFRYFIAVAESGSVAAASRMLSIAQSALTKSLLELDSELGTEQCADPEIVDVDSTELRWCLEPEEPECACLLPELTGRDARRHRRCAGH